MPRVPPYQQANLVEVWDKVAEVYQSMDASAPDHQAYLEQFLGCVGPPAGRSFCEVGCGSGTTSAALARLGARITLVDISRKSLAFAREQFGKLGLKAECVLQNGLGMGFRGGSFDVVWNGGVIEHFTDEGKVALLREMWRVTRPGGLLVILVPNAEDLPFRLGKWIAERRGKWIFGFEDDLTARRFKALAAVAGVPCDECSAHNPIVGWWFLPCGRALTDRLGLNTRRWHAKPSRFGHVLRLAARKPREDGPRGASG
jgi:ubiquinone/menaquinone biosynthesis C-methylase UbiE